MSVKALGTSLKLTFEGKNQLIYPETWFFMLVVVTCVITQMNYLNKVGFAVAFLRVLKLVNHRTCPFHIIPYYTVQILYILPSCPFLLEIFLFPFCPCSL